MNPVENKSSLFDAVYDAKDEFVDSVSETVDQMSDYTTERFDEGVTQLKAFTDDTFSNGNPTSEYFADLADTSIDTMSDMVKSKGTQFNQAIVDTVDDAATAAIDTAQTAPETAKVVFKETTDPSNLEVGETQFVKADASFDVHVGIGGGVGADGKMEFSRDADDEFTLTLATGADVKGGIGEGANEGVSADIVQARELEYQLKGGADAFRDLFDGNTSVTDPRFEHVGSIDIVTGVDADLGPLGATIRDGTKPTVFTGEDKGVGVTFSSANDKKFASPVWVDAGPAGGAKLEASEESRTETTISYREKSGLVAEVSHDENVGILGWQVGVTVDAKIDSDGFAPGIDVYVVEPGDENVGVNTPVGGFEIGSEKKTSLYTGRM